MAHVSYLIGRQLKAFWRAHQGAKHPMITDDWIGHRNERCNVVCTSVQVDGTLKTLHTFKARRKPLRQAWS